MKISKLIPASILLILFALAGCMTTVHKADPELMIRSNTKNILLMPIDIELSILTASGMQEPNAEWTANAKQFVSEAITDKITSNGIALLTETNLQEVALNAEQQQSLTQLIKLHETVGSSILVHQYVDLFKLPNKKGKFAWSLGPEAQFLKEKFDVDYALFVYMRDSYASAGRVGVIIVAAALGVGVQGGMQAGFASLVDLNSGQVVWFNRLIRGAGDLRNPEAAAASVDVLLSNFPI